VTGAEEKEVLRTLSRIDERTQNMESKGCRWGARKFERLNLRMWTVIVAFIGACVAAILR